MRRTVNKLDGIQDLLDKWKQVEPDPEDKIRLFRTQYGNINATGQVGNYQGHAISHNHPQFWLAIEPGVRPLLEKILYRFDWISYTSCEGHSYSDRTIAPAERHTGFIPTDCEETAQMLRVLKHVARKANRRNWFSAIRVRVFSQKLETEKGEFSTVEFYFCIRRMASWQSYFEDLDEMTKKVIKLIDSIEEKLTL